MTLKSLAWAALASAVILAGCGEQASSTTTSEAPKTEAPKTEAPKAETPANESGKASDPSQANPPADPAKEPAKLDTGDKDGQGLPKEPKDGDEVAVLETAKGKLVMMFFPDKAPKAVENFKTLAKKDFFNGTRFHRCIPGFMVQGGDPKSKDLAKSGEWGTGGNTSNGSESTLPDEFNSIQHVRGIVSMANSGRPNSSSSQFFVVTTDSTFLDGKYTAFGKIVKGIESADEIVKTGDAGNNGAVEPSKAIALKSVKITKWPVK
jgi:cyclophilin family peptidyl-prolyl cis-trans isomerase